MVKLRLAKITTEAYFIWLILSLGVLFLVFDTQLATVYTIIIVADFMFYWFNYRDDRVIQFPLEKRTDNRLQSLTTAFIAYGAFLLISSLFLFVASPMAVVGAADYMSVIRLMSTSVPIFAGSMILSLFAFGVLVPAIESSLFFGRLLEKVDSIIERRTKVGIRWDKPSFTWFAVIGICMAIFVLYHLGSKGLANVPLMITGIFAIISCILVIKDGELKSAILLHVISNSLVILSSFGII